MVNLLNTLTNCIYGFDSIRMGFNLRTPKRCRQCYKKKKKWKKPYRHLHRTSEVLKNNRLLHSVRSTLARCDDCRRDARYATKTTVCYNIIYNSFKSYWNFRDFLNFIWSQWRVRHRIIGKYRLFCVFHPLDAFHFSAQNICASLHVARYNWFWYWQKN